MSPFKFEVFMFKPLLSPNNDPKKDPKFFSYLPYPLLVSPKFDGIRGIVKNNRVMSRKFIELPSRQVQKLFGIAILEHTDGELIEGNATDFGVYNRTQSHVMSEDKSGDMTYHLFDYTHPDLLNKPFYERLEVTDNIVRSTIGEAPVRHVFHKHVENYEELLEYESEKLEEGYEGIMMRNPLAFYKQGRATMLQQIIYKLKRFYDDEAVIIGFVERMQNTNKLESDNLGHAKRSSSKEGKVPAGTLGNFIVLYNNVELEVGTGSFTHDELQMIWDNRPMFLGKILKFRYFSHGVKDLPRFPRAVGFRDGIDL